MKILYFSSVPWSWIKQRPQFVSEYLVSNNHEVDYLCMVPFHKFKRYSSLEQGKGKLRMKNIKVVPLGSRIGIIYKLNNILVGKELSSEKYDVIILTHPNQIGLLEFERVKDSKIIYDCMDNMKAFYTGQIRNKIMTQERKLVEIADYIICSSESLKNELIDSYVADVSKFMVINNAQNIEYKMDREKLLSSPNLVYIGTIASWIDIELLIKFSEENSEYTIYLIGPVEEHIKKQIDRVEKIVWIPPVPHEELWRYISSAEIMLIPFKINDLIKCVDPVKMYEYLVFNKKVISKHWCELDKFKKFPQIKFYNDYETFCNGVRTLTKEDVFMNEDQRRKFAFENSWDFRLSKYKELLEKGIMEDR